MPYFDPMIRHLTILFALCVLFTQAMGQAGRITLPYTRYTVADGLSQMQVRTIFLDRDGYLWIGTQGGISGFDGSRLHHYDNLGTVSEGYIWTLARGKDKLYGSTLTETFSFDGRHTEQFTLSGGDKNQVLFEDANGSLWIQDRSRIMLIRKDSSYLIGDLYPSLKSLHFRTAWGDPSWSACYLLDQENRFLTLDPVSGDISADSTTLSPSDMLGYTSNNSAFISNVMIYRIKNCVTDIYRLVDSQLVHVAEWSETDNTVRAINEHAPLGYVNAGACVSKLYILQDSVYRDDLLPQFRHPRFTMSHGHKLYVGSDEGLIVVHFDGLQNFILPECDYPWSVIPDGHNNLFVGCYKNGVFKVQSDGGVHHFEFPEGAKSSDLNAQILSNYLSIGNKLLFGSMQGFYYTDGTGSILNHYAYQYPIEAFGANENSILAGSDKVFWIDATLTQVVDSMDIPSDVLAGAWANDLHVTSAGNLWIAGSGGVVQVNEGIQKTYSPDIGNLPCRGVVTLTEDDTGILWAGGTCGLLRYDKSTDEFHQVLPEIISQRVNQLAIIQSKLVCVANNNLYVLDISGTKTKLIYSFDERNGLNLFEPSENGISVSANRYVWLPSVAGIQRLDLSMVEDSLSHASLRIAALNAIPELLSHNHAPRRITGTTVLIEVSVIDKVVRKWKFQHSINNAGYTPWQSGRELLVSGLRHGSNTVTIRAGWNTSDPSSYLEETMLITTHQPFLKRSSTQWILSGLVLLLLSTVIWALVKQRAASRRLKMLRSDLYRNRLRTIQAYLNPHFLFNTLTSIQDRIMHHDTATGNDMIVRLSRVFRKVLDTGKFESDTIPQIRLSEEIAMIEDIVYLNNKQLTVPVTFELHIDPALRASDPLIPPMLIQPFIENAFKHAFQDDETQKSVRLDIASENGFLIITVVDSGVGYDGLEPLNSGQHQMGLYLVRERMRILDEMGVQNSLLIEQNHPQGTSVKIKVQTP